MKNTLIKVFSVVLVLFLFVAAFTGCDSLIESLGSLVGSGVDVEPQTNAELLEQGIHSGELFVIFGLRLLRLGGILPRLLVHLFIVVDALIHEFLYRTVQQKIQYAEKHHEIQQVQKDLLQIYIKRQRHCLHLLSELIN